MVFPPSGEKKKVGKHECFVIQSSEENQTDKKPREYKMTGFAVHYWKVRDIREHWHKMS